MEGIITNFEFSLPFRAIVLIAICAWQACSRINVFPTSTTAPDPSFRN